MPSTSENEPPSHVVLHTRVVRGAGGGPDKTILNSPRFLTRHGYRAFCAYLHGPSDAGFEALQAKARHCGAPLLPIPDRGPFDARVVTRLLKLCREKRVSIWHGHDYKSNLLGLLIRPFWPMRLVTTVHGWGVREGRTKLYYAVDRLCLPQYDRVICVSNDLYEQCLVSGVSRDRCLLIENAIDTDEYCLSATAGAAKAERGLRPGRFTVGAAGRLSAEKGFDILIEAFDQLLAAGVDAELRIAGEGGERARLQTLITRLKRQDRIRLLGYLPDPRQFFETLDVFVLSSLREGLPNVVLEAMAMEVPVVATKVAGIPRLIQDQENGVLVDPGDVRQLSTALQQILRDRDFRNLLAGAGRKTVEQKHSFARRMEKIRDVYDSVLGRADGRA